VEAGPATGAFYYMRDHLGSVRAMVDNAGIVQALYEYDPHGRRSRTAGDIDSDFGFTGHFHHAESALTLTRFRPYDPDIGRWLSRDPLERAERQEDVNLFVYARNNPINFIDPLGLKRCCASEANNLDAAVFSTLSACGTAAVAPDPRAKVLAALACAGSIYWWVSAEQAYNDCVSKSISDTCCEIVRPFVFGPRRHGI
jgi:RHS repeat-associated protein